MLRLGLAKRAQVAGAARSQPAPPISSPEGACRQRLQQAQRPACVHLPPHRSHRAPARTVAEPRARLARQPRGAGQLGLRESGQPAGAGRLSERLQAVEGQEAPPRSVKWPAWAWRGGRRGGHGARRAVAMGTVGVGLAAGAIGAALGAARRRLGRPWAARGAREVGYFTLCVPPSVYVVCATIRVRTVGLYFRPCRRVSGCARRQV